MKPEALRKLRSEHRRFKKVLKDIVFVGDGIKEDMRDYRNIVKNVKWSAAQALKPDVCVCCGQLKRSSRRQRLK